MNTRDLILKVSKEEFISKGYKESSLRDISAKCYISATAIYRHFKSKEDIFQAIIEPFVLYFNEITRYIEETDLNLLKNKKISEVWDFEHEGNFYYNVLFGEYNDLVKLIAKERKEWFKNLIVDFEIESTIRYINQMKKSGYKIKDFNLVSYRVLLDSYLECYLNLLGKDMGQKELLNICSDINDFYTIGFKNLLGF